MTDRRAFRASSIAWLAASLGAWAQQAGRLLRVAILFHRSPVSDMTGLELRHAYLKGLIQGLCELGYVEGESIRIERRTAEGHLERLSELAAELVGLNVAVIITTTLATIEAALRATSTVPIIMASGPPAPSSRGWSRGSRPSGTSPPLASRPAVPSRGSDWSCSRRRRPGSHASRSSTAGRDRGGLRPWSPPERPPGP
jgi:hypothetical protein